jgi:glycosyltransferase involved in cell wall biosynthesis
MPIEDSSSEIHADVTRATHHIWINGRFLNRKVTGVERVAHEILRAIAEHFVGATGLYRGEQFDVQLHWALPPDFQADLPVYGSSWPRKTVGILKGHAWEQWSLARYQPQDWILNLCNTAPLFKSRQIVFFHDAQVFALPHNFNWKFTLWYKCLLHIAGRRARLLLTNSEFSKRELSQFTGIVADRLKVSHLGVDHMLRLQPELPAVVKQLDPSKSWVLAVSSASPNKNFAGALQAAQRCQAHLVIAGQTQSKVFQDIGLDKSQVTELGYVSDAELLGLYQSATCLIYPSFYEGFGLPPLEAMRMGCPVVLSRTSSMPEVCGASPSYCDPGDIDSIAAALKHLLQLQSADRQAVSEAGQQHAAQFTWKRCAETVWQHAMSAIEQDASKK